jgi:ATP-binding cassette subfamily C protein CydCD
VAVGLVGTAALVAQAALIGAIVQEVLIDHDGLHHTVPALVALAGAFGLRAVAAWAGEVAAHRTSASVTSTLRRQLLTRAVALGPSWLAGERTGELAASATQGVDALDGYFARYLPTLVLSALTPVVLLACIVVRDWFSAVILAVTVAVIPLFMILLGLEATRNADRQWARLSGLAATFYDLLQGLPTLRAFGRTRDGRHTLERANRELHDETMSTLKVAFLSSLALETMASVGTALVALFLGLRLLHGTLPLGTALAILVLAPEVYLPLRRAGAEFHSSAEGRAAAARILDVLDAADAASPPTDWAGARPLPDLSLQPVRLAGVTVRHTGRAQPVLDGVDLSLRPGEHVAVVGESGSGKSTLLNVLMGFVVPESGEVLVGDEPLSACSMREWRRHVAWVPQRPALVRGSLEDNLRLGNPDATANELARALVRSGLDGLVARLPGGLATPVGEGGLTLSAGERQRIAIGRAVLRDVPVVLLDEPTAHLDAAREEELRDALAPWLAGRTLVMAAHRGGLVGRVDRTITLLAGQTVAGTTVAEPSATILGTPPGRGSSTTDRADDCRTAPSGVNG